MDQQQLALSKQYISALQERIGVLAVRIEKLARSDRNIETQVELLGIMHEVLASLEHIKNEMAKNPEKIDTVSDADPT